MVHDVVDERPHLRIRLQHVADERPTCPRGEVVDGRRTCGLRGGITGRDV